MDRRRHHRYAASGPVQVLVLREVEIESGSAAMLTVLTSTPSAAGAEAAVRVTGPDRAHVTLRARVTSCHPAFVDGRRRFRVVYAVLARESRATV
jgi:hypothetical protein